MGKIILGAVATAVMVVGGFMDPGRRYNYLLFIFLGVIATFKAYRAWEDKRAVRPGDGV